MEEKIEFWKKQKNYFTPNGRHRSDRYLCHSFIT